MNMKLREGTMDIHHHASIEERRAGSTRAGYRVASAHWSRHGYTSAAGAIASMSIEGKRGRRWLPRGTQLPSLLVGKYVSLIDIETSTSTPAASASPPIVHRYRYGLRQRFLPGDEQDTGLRPTQGLETSSQAKIDETA